MASHNVNRKSVLVVAELRSKWLFDDQQRRLLADFAVQCGSRIERLFRRRKAASV